MYVYKYKTSSLSVYMYIALSNLQTDVVVTASFHSSVNSLTTYLTSVTSNPTFSVIIQRI